MHVTDVLYVRATETTIRQVVWIVFTPGQLVEHVKTLKPFATKYFGSMHQEPPTVPRLPDMWRDIAKGHANMWRAVYAPILRRDKHAQATMLAKFPQLFCERNGHHEFHTDNDMIHSAARLWKTLDPAPFWPSRAIKTLVQVCCRHCGHTDATLCRAYGMLTFTCSIVLVSVLIQHSSLRRRCPIRLRRRVL